MSWTLFAGGQIVPGALMDEEEGGLILYALRSSNLVGTLHADHVKLLLSPLRYRVGLRRGPGNERNTVEAAQRWLNGWMKRPDAGGYGIYTGGGSSDGWRLATEDGEGT